MAKKLGFALGAGGSRGVAHVGFLKAMEENGIKPDFISGTSMGSVVGSCYALGMSADQMMKEIEKLKFSDIFDLSFNPMGNGAILRAKKLRKKLKQYLGENTFSNLKIPFTAVSTDLISGREVLHCADELVLDGVIASSSIPGVFKPLSYNGKCLVDGGLICRVPIKQVRDMGAEVVVAVDVLGDVRTLDKKFNMFSVLFRTFDIMDASVSMQIKQRLAPDLYLEPDLGNMSQYKFKDLKFAFDKGYEAGVNSAEKIKELTEC